MKIFKYILIGSFIASFVGSWFITNNIQEKKKNAAKVKPGDMVSVEFDPSQESIVVADGRIIIKQEDYNRIMSTKNKDYKTVIEELKTPLESLVYCRVILESKNDIEVYGKEDHHASFKHIHENKKDDCDGGAIATAAILSDNGFPPYVAILSNPGEKKSHEVFIFKTKKGEYCSTGKNISDYQLYPNIEDLKEAIGRGLNKRYKEMVIYDLSKVYPDFIDNDKNNDPRTYKIIIKKHR